MKQGNFRMPHNQAAFSFVQILYILQYFILLLQNEIQKIFLAQIKLTIRFGVTFVALSTNSILRGLRINASP